MRRKVRKATTRFCRAVRIQSVMSGRVRGAPRRLVEAVQLAPSRVRPRCQHGDAHGRQLEGAGEAGGEALGGCLRPRALAALERAGERVDEGPERLRPRQRHGRDGVALEVDGLLAAREPLRNRRRASPADQGRSTLAVGGGQREAQAPGEGRRDVAHVDDAERATGGHARADEEERGAQLGRVGQVAVRPARLGRGEDGAGEARARPPAAAERRRGTTPWGSPRADAGRRRRATRSMPLPGSRASASSSVAHRRLRRGVRRVLEHDGRRAALRSTAWPSSP